MSFAASTAPAAKQQFISSMRFAGLKKIITPKTRQWRSTEELDNTLMKEPGRLKSPRSNEIKPVKDPLISKGTNIKAPNKQAESSDTTGTQLDRSKPKSVSTGEQNIACGKSISKETNRNIANRRAEISGNMRLSRSKLKPNFSGKQNTSSEKSAPVSNHKHPEKTDKENTNLNTDHHIEGENFTGKAVGNNIYITSVSKHKEMLFQRKRYELRIQQLEADLKEVLQFYENLYKENEILKEKLNTDEQLVAEPYNVIFNDRNILRTAEASYKKHIAQLQKDLKIKNKENDSLREEVKRLRAENSKLYDEIENLLAELSAGDEEQEEEKKHDKTFWEHKPYKSELKWLMKKKLEAKDKFKVSKHKQPLDRIRKQ